MTRMKVFVQSTKYQLLKQVSETPAVTNLSNAVSSTIYQFSAFFIIYSIINSYDPVCVINHCYVAYVADLLFLFLFGLVNININIVPARFRDAHYVHDMNVYTQQILHKYHRLLSIISPTIFQVFPSLFPYFYNGYSSFLISHTIFNKIYFDSQIKILTLNPEQYCSSPF